MYQNITLLNKAVYVTINIDNNKSSKITQAKNFGKILKLICLHKQRNCCNKVKQTYLSRKEVFAQSDSHYLSKASQKFLLCKNLHIFNYF